MPDFAPDKLHPTAVVTMQGGFTLGREVMSLRYDLVREVIQGMVNEIDRQVKADSERGRVKLVSRLSNMQVALEQALGTATSVAEFCEPWICVERSAPLSQSTGVVNEGGAKPVVVMPLSGAITDALNLVLCESEALCGVYEAGCVRCDAVALLRQHFGLPVEQAVI